MERKKYYILIISVLLLSVYAQASYKSRIYQAYTGNRMDLWKEVIDEMDGLPVKSNSVELELLNYQYGYIGWCIGEDNNEEANEYLTKAEEIVALLISENYALSMIYSYQAAFCGYKMGMNYFKAPILGPKSKEYASAAIQSNAKNYFAHVQEGNIEFYMPASFGGSKEVAIAHYETAVELMEQDQEKLENDWNYLAVLTLIANAYLEIEEYNQANYYYQKILKIEPHFLYVRDELYPSFLKRLEKTHE